MLPESQLEDQPSSVAAPSARLQGVPRSLWLQADFMKLWLGQTVSLAGSAVTELALPLTAILLLHATPFQLGLLLACESGASAVFGLFAGAWSDRVRRRPLMILADVGRCLLMGAIPATAFLGVLRIEELYLIMAGIGALNSLFAAAYQGYLPTLVRSDQLVSANSRFEGSRVLAQVLGPGMGGALVQALTAPVAIVVDALSFLASGVSITLIRDPKRAAATPATQRNLWREIGQGLRFTLAHPLVRFILLTAVLFNLAAPILNAQLVLFATRELGLNPFLIGLGFVAAGTCGVLASIVTNAITSRLGVGRTMSLAAGLICGGWLLVPFIPGGMRAAAVLLALGASVGTMGDVLFNINAATLRQVVVPDKLQGRVSASMRVLILGVQPLGAVIGGTLGQQIGLRPTLLVAALGFGVAFLSMLFSPMRRVQRPESLAAEVLEGSQGGSYGA